MGREQTHVRRDEHKLQGDPKRTPFRENASHHGSVSADLRVKTSFRKRVSTVGFFRSPSFYQKDGFVLHEWSARYPGNHDPERSFGRRQEQADGIQDRSQDAFGHAEGSCCRGKGTSGR